MQSPFYRCEKKIDKLCRDFLTLIKNKYKNVLMENLLEEEQQQTKPKQGARNASKKKKKKAQQNQVGQADNRTSSIENTISDNQLEDLSVKPKKKKKKLNVAGIESKQANPNVQTSSEQQLQQYGFSSKKKKKGGQITHKESPSQSLDQEHHSYDEQPLREELSLDKVEDGKQDSQYGKNSDNFYETATR